MVRQTLKNLQHFGTLCIKELIAFRANVFVITCRFRNLLLIKCFYLRKVLRKTGLLSVTDHRQVLLLILIEFKRFN